MFPATHKSTTIKDALLNEAIRLGVEIQTKATVKCLIIEESQIKGVELADGRQLLAKAVILATGGASYPGTGSTGDGYQLARSAGHYIEEIYPTEVALTSAEPFIKDRSLQGISLDKAFSTFYVFWRCLPENTNRQTKNSSTERFKSGDLFFI